MITQQSHIIKMNILKFTFICLCIIASQAKHSINSTKISEIMSLFFHSTDIKNLPSINVNIQVLDGQVIKL